MKSIALKSLVGLALIGLSSTAAIADPLEMICINELQPDGEMVTVCYVSESQLPPIVWA